MHLPHAAPSDDAPSDAEALDAAAVAAPATDDSSAEALDELTGKLIATGSRFTRTATRASGESRSLVSLRVLASLQHEGNLRIGELTDRERISQPAMTSTINILERDGLVRRRQDDSDARATVVEITDAGETLLADFRRRAAKATRSAMRELDSSDIQTLQRAVHLLDRLTERITQ